METVWTVIYQRDDGEVFILLFDTPCQYKAHQTLGRWASNPDLDFDWYDAARMSERVAKCVEQ